jgi:ribose transport system substrate-binding protein
MRSRKSWSRRASGLAAGAAALLLAACSSSPSADTAKNNNGSSGGAGSSSGSTAGGVTMSMAEELQNVGVIDSTAFCGTKKITLGIQDGFGINAWSQASMAAVRSEAAKCPNVKTIVQIGEGDLQKSISQINSMVAQGANALVVIPDFGKSELPVLRAATQAGVSVVPWGADPGGTDGTDYVSYVDWSSPSAGTLWANWMVKALKGKGKIAFIGGPAGNPVTSGQLKSVVQVVKANPGIELLTGDNDWPVTNWDPATAQKVMSALLAKYPQIDGVISDYGTDALAATRSFEAAGRKLVPIATLDANGLGCLYQKDKSSQPGFQLATISSRNWLGRVAARKAIAAAAGVQDNEPSKYELPIIEDTLGSPAPTCQSGQPDDFYNSNNISPADIAKFGKP